MKKIKILIFILITICFGCEKYNDYMVENDFSSVYFATQNPVRTIITGQELSFNPGVAIGGVRENRTDVNVIFRVDTTLLRGTGFKPLPPSYYTLSSDSVITIPAGSFVGTIKVTLNADSFLNNPNSITKNFAIPLKIVRADADSILEGAFPSTLPKYKTLKQNNTVIAVKYIVSHHGTYYHSGIDVIDSAGFVLQTKNYYKSLVKQTTIDLLTFNKSAVTTSTVGFLDRKGAMKITLDAGNYEENTVKSVLIETANGSAVAITNALGSYNKTGKAFYLNYKFTDPTLKNRTHSVTDTLIFRDSGVYYETW